MKVNLTWKHVAVIAMFLTAIVALTVSGHDSGALIAVATAVLAGLGVIAGKQDAVKEETRVVREQTNGNTTKLLEMVEGLAHRMAEMTPPPPVDAPVSPAGSNEATQPLPTYRPPDAPTF